MSRIAAYCVVLALVAGCRGIVTPSGHDTKSSSAGSSNLEAPAPPVEPADTDTHNEPKQLSPGQILHTLVITPAQGQRFSPHDRVFLRAYQEGVEEDPGYWSANTCVAFQQLTFGLGTEGPGESEGGVVVALVRPQRAQLWFQMPFHRASLIVEVGNDRFEYTVAGNLQTAPVPVSECLWVARCSVGRCADGTYGDEPEIYPKNPRTL